MFVPYKNYPVTPDKLGLDYKVIEHESEDGTHLVSWWLPGQGDIKGTVFFLHGNAQNISYHQFSVNWLPEQGYNVFLLGYREYGESEGIAMLPDIFMDVRAGMKWVLENRKDDLPVAILGQSMGASLSVYGLASFEDKQKISAVILDAGFDSYPEIAADVLSRNWLSWLLQFPAHLITDEYDPDKWITEWGSMPLLMFHSPDDAVVPYDFGKRLFEAAQAPKIWHDVKGKHIATFKDEANRAVLLEFLGTLRPAQH